MIRVHRDGGILRLHLDKPKKRNALDDEMVATLIDEIDSAGRDESVRSILVTAEGDHFCSGFDIVARNREKPQRLPRIGSIQRRLPAEAHRLIPVLVATQVPIVVAARGCPIKSVSYESEAPLTRQIGHIVSLEHGVLKVG